LDKNNLELAALPTPVREITRLDEARLGILCVTVVACAASYSAHLTSFLHAKEGTLAVGTAVLGLMVIVRGRVSNRGVSFLIPLVALTLTAILAGAVGFAALNRAAAVELTRWSVLGLFVLCVFDLLENAQARRVISGAIVASMGAISLLAMAQYTDIASEIFPKYEGQAHALYSVFGNPGLMGGYLALGLPVAFYYSSKATTARAFWMASTVIISAGLGISGTRSAWAAAIAGTLFVVVSGKLWNRHALACVLLIALAGFCVVFLAPEQTVGRIYDVVERADPSSGLRLWFWSGAIRIFEDHPVFGAGPGNFAYRSPLALAQVLHEPGGERFVHNEIHTLHAHNDILEFGAELGVVGLGLILWWWIRLMGRSGPEWGGLIAFVVFSFFYFPSFSVPHAVVALLFAGMLFSRGRDVTSPESTSNSSGRLIATGVGLCAVLTLPLIVWIVLVPSVQFRTAQNLHLANLDPIPSYQLLDRSPWAPAEVREKLGLALLQAGRFEEAEHEFSNALEALDTGAVYLGLGVARLQQGKNAEAQDAFESCVYRWPSHEFAWELLLRATPPEDQGEILSRARRWLNSESIERLTSTQVSPNLDQTSGSGDRGE
jgi:O-antigen ligase